MNRSKQTPCSPPPALYKGGGGGGGGGGRGCDTIPTEDGVEAEEGGGCGGVVSGGNRMHEDRLTLYCPI